MGVKIEEHIMKQEIFCYVKGNEKVHYLTLDGSLEAHDILAELVLKVSKISQQHSRDVLHDVSGKIHTLINKKHENPDSLKAVF
jgi:hypothetical protein